MRIAPTDRPHPNHIRQSVFFINNYSLVVSRLSVSKSFLDAIQYTLNTKGGVEIVASSSNS